MRVEELIEDFPRLYHMAEEGSWKSIEEHGLLSTVALLDLYEVTGRERVKLEYEHRPESVTVQAGGKVPAVIRDQKPLNMSRLATCLTDMTPSDWIRHLNRRVFFWTSEERLRRLLCARPYRTKAHDVLVIDTAGLVSRHAERVTLAPYNTGATMPTAVPRGLDTFRTIDAYPYYEWRRKRPRWDAVVEVAVEPGVPDVRELVLQVEQRCGSEVIQTLWRP